MTSGKPSRRKSAAVKAPPLERNSATSLYRQIAAQLKLDIRAGRFSASGKLPSEHQLTEQYAVSRVTVRQATALLLEEGVVVRKQGKGTFVASRKLRHDLDSMQGFYDSLLAQGVEPKTRLLEFVRVPATAALTAGLTRGTTKGTRQGTAAQGTPATPPRFADGGATHDAGFFLRRLYTVDDVPFAMVCAYLPPEAASVSWQQASELPIYAILEQLLGLRVTRAETRIRVQQAGAKIGKELGLDPRAPILVMERTSSCADGRVGEHSYFYIRAENYEFLLSTKGPLPICSAIRDNELATAGPADA
jgi:GntR family transcriptional regulator